MPSPPRLQEIWLRVEDRVATLTLDRPQRRNALSPTMLDDLLTALRWCRAEPEVRVVVLTGAGETAFCAGAELGGLPGDSPLQGHRARHAYVEVFELMPELGKPILGRINGHALAGGFGLACSCDLLVAVESATFGTPEVDVGLWPAMVQAVLTRNLPRKPLLEMLLLGERWTAAQLQQLGLVNRVVPRERLDEVTYGLAQKLAAKSPLVLQLGRDSFYRQQDMEFRAALEHLHSLVTVLTLSEDSQEGLRAFLEKREPRWRGR